MNYARDIRIRTLVALMACAGIAALPISTAGAEESGDVNVAVSQEVEAEGGDGGSGGDGGDVTNVIAVSNENTMNTGGNLTGGVAVAFGDDSTASGVSSSTGDISGSGNVDVSAGGTGGDGGSGGSGGDASVGSASVSVTASSGDVSGSSGSSGEVNVAVSQSASATGGEGGSGDDGGDVTNVIAVSNSNWLNTGDNVTLGFALALGNGSDAELPSSSTGSISDSGNVTVTASGDGGDGGSGGAGGDANVGALAVMLVLETGGLL